MVRGRGALLTRVVLESGHAAKPDRKLRVVADNRKRAQLRDRRGFRSGISLTGD